jgi:hypothetical protein
MTDAGNKKLTDEQVRELMSKISFNLFNQVGSVSQIPDMQSAGIEVSDTFINHILARFSEAIEILKSNISILKVFLERAEAELYGDVREILKAEEDILKQILAWDVPANAREVKNKPIKKIPAELLEAIRSFSKLELFVRFEQLLASERKENRTGLEGYNK